MQNTAQSTQITIADFIIKHGIEKLQNYPIKTGDQDGIIKISEGSLLFHSRNSTQWSYEAKLWNIDEKEYFNSWHKKGNYRFYAINESTGFCTWIYGSDLVNDIQTAQLLIVSHKNTLSTQLQKITGDTWNLQDFEEMQDKEVIRHKATGEMFIVLSQTQYDNLNKHALKDLLSYYKFAYNFSHINQ